jgi:hypothetical protein
MAKKGTADGDDGMSESAIRKVLVSYDGGGI